MKKSSIMGADQAQAGDDIQTQPPDYVRVTRERLRRLEKAFAARPGIWNGKWR